MAMVQLRELASLITKGTTPTSVGYEFCNDGINFIKIESITENGGFLIDKFSHISQECDEKIKRSRIEKNDILFSIAGAIGRVALVDESILPANTNQALAIIRIPNGTIYYPYLVYVLKSHNVIEQFEKKKQGVAQFNISLKDVGDFLIPVPKMNVQKSIACKLDKLTTLISLRQKQLEKLDELVKSRFIEMFGDPVSNDRGWNCSILDNVCDGIGDGLHGTPEYDENGKIPFINGNNLLNGAIEVTPSTKMVNARTYEQHYIHISENAILLSINGSLGKLALYRGEKVMLGKSACYCNLKPEINRKFVYGVMQTTFFAEFLKSNSTASTIKNVGLKAIRNFKLIIPPDNLQRKFEEFSNQIDKSKLAVQKSLEQLETLKKSLMQKYFG